MDSSASWFTVSESDIPSPSQISPDRIPPAPQRQNPEKDIDSKCDIGASKSYIALCDVTFYAATIFTFTIYIFFVVRLLSSTLPNTV